MPLQNAARIYSTNVAISVTHCNTFNRLAEKKIITSE